MLLNCGVGEDSWESFVLQGDQTQLIQRKSILNIHWKDWCWSWSSNTLATWCEELTHWKRPWCWKWLKAGGEGDDRGWDGWMASPTQWTWVWVSSVSWWWTGRPAVLQSIELQRVRHDWATELNWKDIYDKTRQCIKKQRHHFADKGPSSQSYGFCSSHIWMWELDYKESWVLKNWCFWTVVLEKTLESCLDCKEIQPVNPKGNQSWIFIGCWSKAPIL